jgi:hypothetical protein
VNGAGWPTTGWKLSRKEEDRDLYELGKGRVVVYRGAIDDPSEFAMDVIDLIAHRNRAARIWNAPAVVTVAAGKGILYCVNYGSPQNAPVQARIQGIYRRATLVRPEAPSATLKTARRGTTTEVEVPDLRRLAVVVFE